MASLSFSWRHDNPAGSKITFNLYENGELAVDGIAQLQFSLLMDGKPHGEYSYYVTATDSKTKLESDPSESVSINFMVPASPDGFTASWAG